MMQISRREAEAMARQSPMFEHKMHAALVEWMERNGFEVARIESGNMHPKLFGEWPRGWKHQMVADAKREALQKTTDWWIDRECKVLPGVGGDVIWHIGSND